MIRSNLGLSTAAAVLLASAACTNDAALDGAADIAGSPPASSSARNESDPPADSAGDAGATDGEDPLAEFELDIVRAEAETLLGMNERDLEPNRMLRIVRRGEERFPATMDLRPGRMNVELDEHAGAYVVTRVVVETPEGSEVVE